LENDREIFKNGKEFLKNRREFWENGGEILEWKADFVVTGRRGNHRQAGE
jgi:hypothetical protein